MSNLDDYVNKVELDLFRKYVCELSQPQDNLELLPVKMELTFKSNRDYHYSQKFTPFDSPLLYTLHPHRYLSKDKIAEYWNRFLHLFTNSYRNGFGGIHGYVWKARYDHHSGIYFQFVVFVDKHSDYVKSNDLRAIFNEIWSVSSDKLGVEYINSTNSDELDDPSTISNIHDLIRSISYLAYEDKLDCVGGLILADEPFKGRNYGSMSDIEPLFCNCGCRYRR